VVSDTHQVRIDAVCVGLEDVTIGGEATARVGEQLDLVSTYQPDDATPPLIYEWSTDGLASDQGADSASYVWELLGVHTVVLTATNCDGTVVVTDTHEVLVEEVCIGLESVAIQGGDTVTVGVELDLFSAYQPSDVTLPISYEWSEDGLVSDQGADSATYTWDTPGLHTVVLTATNCEGAVSVTVAHEVMVTGAEASLELAKFDSPDPVMAGAPLTYTIVVTNTGQVAVTGLVITDTYSDWTIFGEANPEPSEVNNVWYLEMLLPGDFVVITVQTWVSEALSEDTTLTNIVLVDSAETDPLTMAEETLAEVPFELAKKRFLIGLLEGDVDLYRHTRCLANAHCFAP
jgi:uncharacterized repeat protein (TIGR01451 family)